MLPTQFAAESSVGQILIFLQRHAEATIRDLEDELGISTTAVREHLTNLDARGFIATRLVRSGRGRPRIVYSLTERARELFPRSYDTLMSVLLDEIERQQGGETLHRLLTGVSQRLAENYQQGVQGNLASRIIDVQKMMEARGIPVDVRATEQSFTFYACPYHEVAQDHADVCAMEKRMLEQVLGHSVQSDSAIREGGRCCNFSVAQSDTITLSDK
jgi:DeoR family suf operon transcriptional repressor